MDLESTLRGILSRLEDRDSSRAPRAGERRIERLRNVTGALSSLLLYHRLLAERLASAGSRLARSSASPREIRPELPDSSLDDLLLELGDFLNRADEVLRRFPPRDEDVPSTLELCLAVETELASHLDMDLVPRLFPSEPPVELLPHLHGVYQDDD